MTQLTTDTAYRQYLSLTLAAAYKERTYQSSPTAKRRAAFQDASNRSEAFARSLVVQFGATAAYRIFTHANTERNHILAA